MSISNPGKKLSCLITFLAGAVMLFQTTVCAENKKAAVENIRRQMAAGRASMHYSIRGGYNENNVKQYYDKLRNDGKFSDLNFDSEDVTKREEKYQRALADKLLEAFKRIRYLSQSYYNGSHKGDSELKAKLFKAITYYSGKEMKRPDAWFRFHISCFGIPNAAYGTYFIFFEDFDAAEKGKSKDQSALQASRSLRDIMSQTFTQPRRSDTNNSINVEQFRNHVWWVGGNFAYRPLFETAAVCSNPQMFDVIATVCENAMAPVSWNTRKTAFWSEGMTSDGAGWGHGNQCYVWGYPLHGLRSLVNLSHRFKGTPWETDKNIKLLDGLADYVDAMSWYQWRQYQTLLSPGRVGFIAGAASSEQEIKRFGESILEFNISKANATRIKRIIAELSAGQDQNFGNKSFWNNDDMVQRRKDYYLGISMLSARTVSNEIVKGSSTHTDNLGDGTTFIMTHPGEYKWVKGFWNYTALPGTTLRQGNLKPHTIWAGYAGTENFAANVSDGKIGCAGFISEKERKKSPNECLFDLRSVKGYFLFEDEFVALGNSIENKSRSQKGEIWTTLDQSEWRKPLLIGDGGKVTEVKTGESYNKTFSLTASGKPVWCIEDGVGYIVLPAFTDGKLVIKAEKRTKSNWGEIDKRNNSKEKPASLNMFQIYINHGNAPRHDKYAYIVNFRLKDAAMMNAYLKDNPIKILSNTAQLQAVAHAGLKTRQMIFYSERVICRDGGFSLKVDKPAAVIVRELDNGQVAVTVSDPRQLPSVKSVAVTTSLKLSGDGVKKLSNGSILTVALPGKPYCGKPVTVVYQTIK